MANSSWLRPSPGFSFRIRYPFASRLAVCLATAPLSIPTILHTPACVMPGFLRIAWSTSNSAVPIPSSRRVRTVNLPTSRAIFVIFLLVISIAASRQKDVASTKSDDTTSFWFVKQQAYGPGRLSKNPPGEEPRRVPSSADGGRKVSSVISGDTCVGNDTSHDGQGDFSARIEPCPSCIPLSKKARGLFRQAETGSGPARRGGASAPLAQTLGAKRIHFARAFEIKG